MSKIKLIRTVVLIFLLIALLLNSFGCRTAGNENESRQSSDDPEASSTPIDSSGVGSSGTEEPMYFENEYGRILDKNDPVVKELAKSARFIGIMFKEPAEEPFWWDLKGIKQYNKDGSIISSSKGTIQPVLVAFDSSRNDHRYVCCYYGGPKDWREYMSEFMELYYERPDDFLWVEYEDTDEISDYYGDKRFILSFQLDKAILAKDIIFEEATIPDTYHFREYTPVFENHYNTAEPRALDVCFIYRNNHGKDFNARPADKLLVSAIHTDFTFLWSCACLDGQYYLRFSGEFNASYEFGDYYDDMIEILDPPYQASPYPDTEYYFVSIDDFAKYIKGDLE